VVEGMTAEEILAETGTGKDSKMRHFTGTLFPKMYFVHNEEVMVP
jgi:hypothetical protein